MNSSNARRISSPMSPMSRLAARSLGLCGAGAGICASWPTNSTSLVSSGPEWSFARKARSFACLTARGSLHGIPAAE